MSIFMVGDTVRLRQDIRRPFTDPLPQLAVGDYIIPKGEEGEIIEEVKNTPTFVVVFPYIYILGADHLIETRVRESLLSLKLTQPKATVVKAGQIWKNLDPRGNGKRVKVEGVANGKALLIEQSHPFRRRTATVTSFLKRQHTARGYRLIKEGQGS